MPKKRGRQTANTTPAPDDTCDLSHIVEPLRPLAVECSTVRLDPRNARSHGDADLAATAASLAHYGQRKPIVVNRATATIEAGNGTYRAATELLGWSHLAVVFVDDDPSSAMGFSLADNRTAELSSWDELRLAELLAENPLDPELAELLDLDSLLPAAAASDQADAVAIPVVYGCTVDCKTEAVQQLVYQLLVDHQEEFPDAEIKLQTM